MEKEQKLGWLNKTVLAQQQKRAENKRVSDTIALAEASEENRKQQRILELESEANKVLEMWDKCKASELLMDIKKILGCSGVHSTLFFGNRSEGIIHEIIDREQIELRLEGDRKPEFLKDVLVSYSLEDDKVYPKFSHIDAINISYIVGEAYDVVRYSWDNNSGDDISSGSGSYEVPRFTLKLDREGWTVSGYDNWMETELGNQATINTPEKLGEQLDTFLAKLILNPYKEPTNTWQGGRDS